MAAIECQNAAGEAEPGLGLTAETLDAAFGNVQRRFDRAHGGRWGAPKFPQPMALEFLLRYHHTTGDPDALHMVTCTLDAMARGGIYGQIGGGFRRYAVGDRGLVPPFPKAGSPARPAEKLAR